MRHEGKAAARPPPSISASDRAHQPTGTTASTGGRGASKRWLGIEDSNLGYLIQSQAAYH